MEINFIIVKIHKNNLKIAAAECLTPYQVLSAFDLPREGRTSIFNDASCLIWMNPVRCNVFHVPFIPDENGVQPFGHHVSVGLISGNKITSRMLCAPVSIMTSRSIPSPMPPAGGMP